jgi:prepilin-type N-terminal cleavage/methylation domain-containing protein
MKTKKMGFTLVEIMIVVAIIALLTTIAIPAFLKYRRDAHETMCVNNMRNIEHAKQAYGISSGIAEDEDIAWSNINEYLNLGLDDLLTCPEGGANSQYYRDDDDGVEPNVTADHGARAMGTLTNAVTCPNVATYSNHVYRPGQ